MTSAGRVFLDTNIWNDLAERRGPLTAETLKAAYHDGRIEVIGSVDLLEEITGTANKRPAKYDRMRSMWRQLCGKRILSPIKERHRAEVLAGGILSTRDRYLPASVVKALSESLGRLAVIREINKQVFQHKQHHFHLDVAARDAMKAEIEAQRKRPRDFDRRITANVIHEWTADVAAQGAEFGLPDVPTGEVSYERLPSLWLLCGYSAARATRVARYGSRIQDSDNHDSLHCAAGAYYDVLVTSDREFRATLELLPVLPFEILQPSEFAASLA